MTGLFDQRLIHKARQHMAADYARVAVFQGEIEKELIARLKLLSIDINDVAIVGAGNLLAGTAIANQFAPQSIAIVDVADNMLQLDLERIDFSGQSRREGVVKTHVSDIHTLPLPAESVDLVFSNLYLNWADDSIALIDELFRVLKPGGCVHFSCLGPDSFEQLRNAWKAAEPGNHYHVIVPPDMHDIGDALVGAGFTEPVMDRTNYQLKYSSVSKMFEDLRDNGLRNYFHSRAIGLTPKGQWQRFLDHIESQAFATETPMRYLLTLEAVIGQAWKPLKPRQQRREDGSVAVPVAQMFDDLKSRRG